MFNHEEIVVHVFSLGGVLTWFVFASGLVIVESVVFGGKVLYSGSLSSSIVVHLVEVKKVIESSLVKGVVSA